MVKTYGELYLQSRDRLREKEGQFAANIARELICAACEITVEELIARKDEIISAGRRHLAEDYVSRYAEGEPLPYILGQWDFYDMTLEITPDVLIPRDDTMVVTELAIKKALYLEQNPRILDLCTGSGCIGMAIAKRVKDARVTLADISQEALRVAKRNVQSQRLSARVSCITLDVREPAAEFLGNFHLIVSNPPYITTQDMKTLDPSVRDFEPELALHGGEDGLDFYRAIIKNYTSALIPGGYLCLEFGMGQEEAVCELLTEGGYDIHELRKDSGDIIRAVLARKREDE